MGKNGYLRKCCVPNCSNVKHYNRRNLGDEKTSHNYSFRLFKFPVKDLKRCKKWLKLICQPEMVIRTNTRICSHHFTKDDYFEDKNKLLEDCSVGRRCLKGTALPSKWLPENKEEDTLEGTNEEEEEEPCLICSGKVGGKQKRRRYKFEGAENSKLLNEQLWSTFILREVLKIEQDKYGEILEMVGGSVQPGKWFGICEDCETNVVKILGFRKAIRKLEGEIKEVEGILNRRLEESLEGKGDKGFDEILNVRREIRKCLKKENTVQVEIKNEEFEDNQDDNPSDINSSEDSESEYKPEVNKSPRLLKREQLKLKLLQLKSLSKRKSRAKPKPSCDLCSYKAWSPSKMERHIINHKLFDNSTDPSISTTQFYCNLCPTSPIPSLFSTRRHLMRHKRLNHAAQLNLSIFNCPDCPESFLYKANYLNHLFKNHPSRYHSTLSTNPTTEKSADLNQPNDNPSQTYLCDKCNYSTLFKHQFTRHLNFAHTSIPFICQYCSCPYKYSFSLQAHIKRYHPEQWTGPQRNIGVPTNKPFNHLPKKFKMEKIFKCKYCDDETSSQFPHKLALGLHLKESHKDLFKWRCNLCDKSYLRQQSLQTHLKINHLESGMKGKCKWCGKEVQHQIYLLGHYKICLKRPPNLNKKL